MIDSVNPHHEQEAAPMFALVAIAQVASAIGAVRRAFASAAEEPTAPWLPRLTNYPY
jgi:hypothetical protein